jgi:hypothetical protein
MSIRQRVSYATVDPGVVEMPARGRPARFIALTIGAGLVAAIAAAIGIGPFAGLHPSVVAVRAEVPATPIAARTLFPPVPPLKKVVYVIDPPPATASRPPVRPAPARQPPTPSPVGGDDGGGGDD